VSVAREIDDTSMRTDSGEGVTRRVTRSFISSCSSASVHFLPCGPQIAEEKESGFPAPSMFKSAGAGDYTGGALVGAEAEERRA
jgi:hypothetical protein